MAGAARSMRQHTSECWLLIRCTTAAGRARRGALDQAGTPAGWYSVMNPSTAVAATVSGLARYIWPGPERPGKLRFCAEMTTWSLLELAPGPALMQAPQDGSTIWTPALLKIASYPCASQYRFTSWAPYWMKNFTSG